MHLFEDYEGFDIIGFPEIVGAPLGAVTAGGLTYLLRDEFTTTQAAPLTSPRTCEPGPGTLTINDSGNKASISGGTVLWTSSTANWDPTLLHQSGLTRVNGLLFQWLMQMTGRAQFGLANSGTNTTAAMNTSRKHTFDMRATANNLTVIDGSGTSIVTGIAIADSTVYKLSIWVRSSGAAAFISGGAYSDPTLLWIDDTGNYTPFPFITAIGAASAQNTDSLKATALGAPFNTDYGIASVNVTSFTQSLGAELLTNGNFAAWTADNPTSWSVTETAPDPEVTERAPTAGHGDAVGAGGAANLYSSVTGSRPILQQTISGFAGKLYQYEWNATKVTSGQLLINDNSEVTSGINAAILVGVGRLLFRAGPAATAARWRGNVLPVDITLDDISVKEITVNTQVTAAADGIFDGTFTQPGTPVQFEEFALLLRMASAGDEWLNGWAASIRYNGSSSQFDAFLSSIASGVKTVRTSATSIGATVNTVRVIATGALLDLYTLAGTTWTKRGSQVSNSTYQTNTKMNIVYVGNYTPTRMAFYPRTSSNYNILTQV